MTRDITKSGAKPAPHTREERLKAALKANMGRRKAQARARAEQDEAAETKADGTTTDPPNE